MNLKLFSKMMAAALTAVEAKKDELSALDGATGDGDHGIAICEAMNAAVAAIKPDAAFKQALNDMGFGIMMATSGSISTLLGALFLGMSDGVEKDELNGADIAAMFASGLENVRQQTKADIGDKTMMDALIPAVAALAENQAEGIEAMFAKAAAAADEGRASTKGMVAKFGRARNLGERVIGHLDAGATSITYIFKAFAETVA
ncbi:MAG: dihydroxyacetone kinase subunit L [Kiritimatiellales bacterium]|nr:dihydroxyacetone kinase subunit L [Kiritimatiellales bacterium]